MPKEGSQLTNLLFYFFFNFNQVHVVVFGTDLCFSPFNVWLLEFGKIIVGL